MENNFSHPYPLNTAVLFLIYNRLDATKKVFGEIKKAKPPRLYIASDGPKENRNDETQKIKDIRNYIISHIDWQCKVKTLFRKDNLGCKYAVSRAINWFFDYEEMGIILEDDCLPSQSFFWFCEIMLHEYTQNKKIAMISGRNNLGEYKSILSNHIITYRGFVWGWATWRDRVKDFDVEIVNNKKNIIELVKKYSRSKIEYLYRKTTISAIKRKKVDSWDYPMNLKFLLDDKYTVVSTKNLVLNLGYGNSATHTKKNISDDVQLFESDIFFIKKNIYDNNFSDLTILGKNIKTRIKLLIKYIMSFL